jgi:hypothetical protein
MSRRRSSTAIAGDPLGERAQVSDAADRGHEHRHTGEAERDRQHQQQVAVRQVVIEVEQGEQADGDEPCRLKLEGHEGGGVTLAKPAVPPGEDPLGYIHPDRLHGGIVPDAGAPGAYRCVTVLTHSQSL